MKLKRIVSVVTLLTQTIIPSADADVGADKYRAQARRILLHSSAQGSSPQSIGQRKILLQLRECACETFVAEDEFPSNRSPQTSAL